MKFYGVVGFAQSVKVKPGVWEEQIVEKTYFGDVERNTRQMEVGDKVNPDLTISNSVSILADNYASEHIQKIRYVEWDGGVWTVDDVQVRRPRFILRMGGVYNGPRPDTSGEAPGAP